MLSTWTLTWVSSLRTKTINCTVNPKWREGFDFYWYEEDQEEYEHKLEITIWDKDIGRKDDFMGR